MSTNWSDLPRMETTRNRLDRRIIKNNISVSNLAFGINVYKNAISKETCRDIVSKLESAIDSNESLSWNNSLVNDKEQKNYNRNCVDFKYKREDLGSRLVFSQDLHDIHKTIEDSLDICLDDYGSLWHLQMKYKEAFNFVKYGPGEYFKTHSDHGPYYTCAVSAVIYLNDDYVGGDLEFIRQGLRTRPEAGDIFLFPSNFVYEHQSLEIFSGTKYSVVIMTDYNDTFHKN